MEGFASPASRDDGDVVSFHFGLLRVMLLRSKTSLLCKPTSVARILQWGVENDITFNYTLYTEADPVVLVGGYNFELG